MSNFIEELKARRSQYALTSESPVGDQEIVKTVEDVTVQVPSAFNSQPQRAVVLFGDANQKLWNIVKETLRKVVSDDEAFKATEAKINAFAAGYGPADAAVAVTRGALDRLNRDELQGVIAHEFSHVLNGDMRLNIRLIGLLFGILMLSLIGQRILLYGRFGRSRDTTPILLAAMVAMLVGSIGVFFGRMIKAGVSRQREYLADASAVQFTRNPQGISGALKRIAVDATGSTLESSKASEIGHFFFAQGLAQF